MAKEQGGGDRLPHDDRRSMSVQAPNGWKHSAFPQTQYIVDPRQPREVRDYLAERIRLATTREACQDVIPDILRARELYRIEIAGLLKQAYKKVAEFPKKSPSQIEAQL